MREKSLKHACNASIYELLLEPRTRSAFDQTFRKFVLELFKIAVKNVSKRKKRAALTILGIFIGIAAVVALVSLGQGLQNTINAQFEMIGADKIMIQAKEMGFSGENAPGQLTTHELDLVDNVNGVVEACGYIVRGVNVRFNNVQRTVFGYNIPDDAGKAVLFNSLNNYEAESGRLLSYKDKMKVMIGSDVASKKFSKVVSVGNKLWVSGEIFDVVGVLKRVGDPGADGAVIMSEADARRIFNESDALSVIVAQSAKGVDPELVADKIEKAIRRDRHQKEGKEDFSVQTSTQMIESFMTILAVIQVVFVGIAAISLLVGGIGIMHVMFTAVLERTREIGIMKAIGARNSDILGLFLIESGILGLAGGAVGVIIGIGISKAVEYGINVTYGIGTLSSAFPIYLIVGALLFSFVIGAVSGVLPARRASKLRPVEALRYE
ncbi:MacB-like periplasmic core domain protein [uncultured archaeon]|nr:MacB-like periplasmic core domain protein [uncultured archaeon]